MPAKGQAGCPVCRGRGIAGRGRLARPCPCTKPTRELGALLDRLDRRPEVPADAVRRAWEAAGRDHA